MPTAAQPPAIICQAPRAIDGDTIRCANLAASVRLAGIDAPELPGHCRRGRLCTPGDALASKRALAAMMRLGPVRVQIIGSGGYGRHLGVVWTGGVNLNCQMLARRLAVRRYQKIRCKLPAGFS